MYNTDNRYTLEFKRSEFFKPYTSEHSDFRKQWKQIVNSDKKEELTAFHYFLYVALCGKDAIKSFTLTTNHNKIYNGHYINDGLHTVHRNLRRVIGQITRLNNITSGKVIFYLQNETAMYHVAGALSRWLAPDSILEKVPSWSGITDKEVYKEKRIKDAENEIKKHLGPLYDIITFDQLIKLNELCPEIKAVWTTLYDRHGKNLKEVLSRKKLEYCDIWSYMIKDIS